MTTSEAKFTHIGNGPASAGKYVVMRHRKDSKQMKCSALYDTYEEAHARAQVIYPKLVEEDGKVEIALYIMRVVDRVGVIDGVLEPGGNPK